MVAQQLINEAKELNVPLHSLIVIILTKHAKQSNQSIYENRIWEIVRHKWDSPLYPIFYG